MRYNPIYKEKQLTSGDGVIAIVTGWTVKDFVAKKLEPSEYAVIGQLYSPARGINILIRNLLANPHVTVVTILNATREDINAGGCQCLYDFFERGFVKGVDETGEDCWVIDSEHYGIIDIEIPREVLDNLRAKFKYEMDTSVSDLVDTVKHYYADYLYEKHYRERTGSEALPDGKPQLFPERPRNNSKTLPGNLYGHRVEGKTIAETWVKIIHRIKTTGVIRPTGYGGQWQELIDLVAVVTDEPKEFYFPTPNFLPTDPKAIEAYLPQMTEDAPYTEGVKYTYGQRMRSWFGIDQVEEVIKKLINEIDAASAVINLWDSGSGCPLTGNSVTRYGRSSLSSDHQYGGSPCLNHIWFRVVDGKLSVTATFRSNDMFMAWVSNAMGLRALQWHVLEQINARSNLNLGIAPLITISQSAHIYDDCWANADWLIKNHYLPSQLRSNYNDPVGEFVIEIVEDDNKKVIQISQIYPGGGSVVATYYARNAILLVLREICAANPAIQPDHAAYLGAELQRAKTCLDAGIEYKQDH